MVGKRKSLLIDFPRNGGHSSLLLHPNFTGGSRLLKVNCNIEPCWAIKMQCLLHLQWLICSAVILEKKIRHCLHGRFELWLILIIPMLTHFLIQYQKLHLIIEGLIILGKSWSIQKLSKWGGRSASSKILVLLRSSCFIIGNKYSQLFAFKWQPYFVHFWKNVCHMPYSEYPWSVHIRFLKGKKLCSKGKKSGCLSFWFITKVLSPWTHNP